MNYFNCFSGLSFIASTVVLAFFFTSFLTACSLPTVSNKGVQAVALLHKAAEQGDAIAQFQLGGKYENGYVWEGVSQDYQQALSWYRKAAEQGHAKAQYRLGQIFETGLVAHSSESALKWMLEKNQSVKQDHAQAMIWYRRAAEQGLANAQFNLGRMYANHKVMGHDDTQAVIWYRKAAEQGHVGAQNNLGTMFYNGHGVTQDYSKALIWFEKAAEQGYPIAIKNVKVTKPIVEMAERRKYLESPEGKAETKRVEAKSEAENKRMMLICDHFGKDIEKRYNFGKYHGTLSRSHLGGDIYFCVAIFKREALSGLIFPNYKGITLNRRTGVYEIESL